MTTDQLRATIVTDIDKIFDSPRLLTMWLTEDSKRLLRAQRRFWQETDASTLQKMLDLYQQEA